MARSVLGDLGVAADNGFGFGVLSGRNDARAAAIEAELPQRWRRVRLRPA